MGIKHWTLGLQFPHPTRCGGRLVRALSSSNILQFLIPINYECSQITGLSEEKQTFLF
jgi:hypothetical protein